MSKENPTTVDVYAVLCEIRDYMKSMDATMAHLLALSEARTARAKTNGKPLASEAELDGQYGDPTIAAKDPRDWSGESMKGKHFSECPPEYLDLLAERFDYFNTVLGDSDEDKKKRMYNTKDAARARGWAARIRNGWKPPAASTSNPFGGSDDAAF